ncbi:MAG: L-rhamnose mutarotase [Petrimonas sp.]|nr:L-rhamnose mutarotase [Petrimonas sp.]
MKRFCQTLSLKNDPELIEAYVREHANVWPEIQEGIRAVGILDMQIFMHENRLFMIVDTVDDFDWDKDMERLAALPRQAEWEAYMDKYQDAGEGKKSNEKWQIMQRIFKLK